MNPAFKLLIAGRRRSDMSVAEHRHHILEKHGKMVLELIQAHPNHAPRRYAQNRVVDGTWRAGGPASDPFALTRDFVTQVWFDNPAQAMDALSHPLYKANLLPDEDRFVDQASVVKLAVRERILRLPSAKFSPVGRFKLFVFFSKSVSTSSIEFTNAWEQRGQELAVASDPGLIQHYVQNQVMSKPGETPCADGVDEFWVEDLAAASLLAKVVQSTITAPLLAGGWLGPQMSFHLMAEESLLFSGASA